MTAGRCWLRAGKSAPASSTPHWQSKGRSGNFPRLMQQRAAKKKTSSKSAPPRPPASHCRAMVRVDGTAIRKKIKQDYERALRDLTAARKQFDQFQQTDQPQFIRWLNSHFGALLTEMRELSQQLAADEALIFMVESEAMFGGGSLASAYRRVMKMRENPEPPPPPNPADFAPDGQSDFHGPEPGTPDDGDDPLEELFNEIFGEFDTDSHQQQQGIPHSGRNVTPHRPAPAAAGLKDLYRALVRRLHPDSQREMTAQKTEWWHQAQAAYQAGDAEQLEVILTLCEIGDSGTTANTSATLLQRITGQLKNSLRQIKRQITEQRRNPAWNFSQRTDHAVMAERVRREMTEDLERMRERRRQLQELIAGWKAAADRPKPARRRKRQPPNPEFPC